MGEKIQHWTNLGPGSSPGDTGGALVGQPPIELDPPTRVYSVRVIMYHSRGEDVPPQDETNRPQSKALTIYQVSHPQAWVGVRVLV